MVSLRRQIATGRSRSARMRAETVAILGSVALHLLLWTAILPRQMIPSQSNQEAIPIEWRSALSTRALRRWGRRPIATPSLSDSARPRSFPKVFSTTSDRKVVGEGGDSVALTTGQLVRWGNAPPQYPLEAQNRGWEGNLRLRIRFTNEGRVSSADLVSSSGHRLLDDAALEAARQWKIPENFGWNRTRTVRLTVEIPVEFRLVD
jgi:periplasmic protein TonB